ncbi:hypothetical protein PAXINDRAFT_19086 [Paxillus involutus ATCC 200175]|uniref:Uncharacterized protein n=1 Tax=Paxillus involutus ATCC 200175 TaxID=664439 RepID=A0A0C9SXK8_PAXIN|nr:hypothetical protein PAXINDRAFT_19086 [Paxillus involutus ATCC 200175]
MLVHPGDTSHKPSGSSMHSLGHSPSASPSNAQSQRQLAPAAVSNMFGVRTDGVPTLKGVNSGQVWGSMTPASIGPGAQA